MSTQATRRLVAGLAVLIAVLAAILATTVWFIHDRGANSVATPDTAGTHSSGGEWVTSAAAEPEGETTTGAGAAAEMPQSSEVAGQAPAFSYDVFQSPTGNILCQVGGQFAGVFGGDSAPRAACHVGSFSGQAPKPDCQGGVSSIAGAGAIDSSGRAVQGLCAGGQPFGYRGDRSSLPVLAYGHATSDGRITCTSRDNGMTCEDLTSGEQFTVSRQAVSLNGR